MTALLLLFLAAAGPRVTADPTSTAAVDVACAADYLSYFETRLEVPSDRALPLVYTATSDVANVVVLSGDSRSGIQGLYRLERAAQRGHLWTSLPCHRHEIAHHAITERWGWRVLPLFVEEGLASHLAWGDEHQFAQVPISAYYLKRDLSIYEYGVALRFVERTWQRTSWKRFLGWLDRGAKLEEYRRTFGFTPEQTQ